MRERWGRGFSWRESLRGQRGKLTSSWSPREECTFVCRGTQGNVERKLTLGLLVSREEELAGRIEVLDKLRSSVRELEREKRESEKRYREQVRGAAPVLAALLTCSLPPGRIVRLRASILVRPRTALQAPPLHNSPQTSPLRPPQTIARQRLGQRLLPAPPPRISHRSFSRSLPFPLGPYSHRSGSSGPALLPHDGARLSHDDSSRATS